MVATSAMADETGIIGSSSVNGLDNGRTFLSFDWC